MQSRTEEKEPRVPGIAPEKLLLEATQERRSLFIKSANHFTVETRFAIPDESKHHSAHTSKKKSKLSPNKNRDENEWIRITNTLIQPAYAERENKLMVLAGEIYRFEIGNTQPKYRVFKHPSGPTEIISKKLPECTEFYTYSDKNIYPNIDFTANVYHGNDFFEGMGRVIFAKYIYLENDFNSGNDYLTQQNGQQYYVGIDHDQSFHPLSIDFHVNKNSNKELGYPADRNDTKYVKIKIPGYVAEYYLVTGKQKEYIGEFDVADYDNLPFIKYYVPKNWYFMGKAEKPYFTKLGKTKLFNNEKHFSAFKMLVTPFMKTFLTEFHITHEGDKKVIHKILADRLKDLNQICEKSIDFQNYINQHYFAATKAIIYEMRLFFEDNRHYLPKDKSVWKTIWKSLSAELLKHVEALLNQLNIHLIVEQQQELSVFAEHCETNPAAVIPVVAQFYEQQLMDFHKKVCLKKLNKLTGFEESKQDAPLTSVSPIIPAPQLHNHPNALFNDRQLSPPKTVKQQERKCSSRCVML